MLTSLPSLPFLKLAHLKLVAAIAQHGQMQAAAQALALTQPAASRSLAEIERLVGAPLFERHPRGMTPTSLGEILVRRAHTVLTEMQNLGREMQEEREGRSGLVQAGAVTGPAVGFLVPAIRRLKAVTPHVELRVDVGPSVQLMRGLDEGDYDFIIGRLLPDSDVNAFDIVPGEIETVRCVVRSSHPLATRRDVSLAALAEYPWIIQERGMPIRQAVEAAFIHAGLPVPADVVATSSLVLMMALLVESDMIAPMSLEVARLMEGTGTGSLAVVDLAVPIEVSPYHIITRRGRRLSPAASRLHALVLDEAERLRGSV
ncbi:LysR family transcriptional regulator [Pseudaminobacter soli (ex Li et al. 2025)]|uniref:Transcriptional regulator n=1 Tax=Pseudaminobacter soli (ex Li et al. 2025) TaxID=1295366 RepID=A0A2P7SBB2_9HYPH|nr:LysR family transcriptional regulator [Mesorhizobium soli]PSJ59760.1 transcriptional regulator [Mesorhizobium soli]